MNINIYIHATHEKGLKRIAHIVLNSIGQYTAIFLYKSTFYLIFFVTITRIYLLSTPQYTTISLYVSTFLWHFFYFHDMYTHTLNDLIPNTLNHRHFICLSLHHFTPQLPITTHSVCLVYYLCLLFFD